MIAYLSVQAAFITFITGYDVHV